MEGDYLPPINAVRLITLDFSLYYISIDLNEVEYIFLLLLPKNIPYNDNIIIKPKIILNSDTYKIFYFISIIFKNYFLLFNIYKFLYFRFFYSSSYYNQGSLNFRFFM